MYYLLIKCGVVSMVKDKGGYSWKELKSTGVCGPWRIVAGPYERG